MFRPSPALHSSDALIITMKTVGYVGTCLQGKQVAPGLLASHEGTWQKVSTVLIRVPQGSQGYIVASKRGPKYL